MSTIGRIFVVLNLLLSGGFIYFSGIYLTNATQYREVLETEREDRAKELRTEQEARQKLEGESLESRRTAESAREAQRIAEERVTELEAANQRLEAKNSEYDSNLKQLRSDYGAMVAKIDEANELLKRTTKDQNEARTALAQAEVDRDRFEGDLGDARNKISELNDQLAKQEQSNSSLEKDYAQEQLLNRALRKVLVANGIDVPTALVPDLRGTVLRVENRGNLLTIRITGGDEGAEVEVGQVFSVYSGGNLTGIATVTEVYSDGITAFCTYRPAAGTSGPSVGDSASTK